MSAVNRKVFIVLGLYRPDPVLLSRQLRSLVSQTHKSVEILVCPDGPMELAARGVIADFSLSPVHVLGFGDRVGVHANFARGLGAALGESGSAEDLFAFCDQDDLWHPDKLERQIACFADPRTSLSHSDARIVAREENVLVSSLFEHEERSREASLVDLLVMNSVSGMTAVFRRDVAEVARQFPLSRNPHVLHDHWVALVASLLGSIRFIHEPLADYTQHTANVMGARSWQEQPPRRGLPKDRRAYLRKSYREFLWRRHALSELRRASVDLPIARGRLDGKIVSALFDCRSGGVAALALLARYRLGGQARQADQVWRIIRGKSLFCAKRGSHHGRGRFPKRQELLSTT